VRISRKKTHGRLRETYKTAGRPPPPRAQKPRHPIVTTEGQGLNARQVACRVPNRSRQFILGHLVSDGPTVLRGAFGADRFFIKASGGPFDQFRFVGRGPVG